LALMASLVWWGLGLPARYFVETGLLYGAAGLLILARLPESLPLPGMGAANRVTLVRLTLVLPVTALVLHPQAAAGSEGRWWIIVASTIALILDGVDGRIARRTDTTSAFGARFDMELDAFLMLALALLVWVSGRVGAWVLLIGAMRYAFVAASWLLPALRAELPESRRRKVVCVVQGAALLVSLGPIIAPPLAVFAAALALITLVYSFGVDVVWLLHRSRR